MIKDWVLDLGCQEGATVAQLTLIRKTVGLISQAIVQIAKLKRGSMDFVLPSALHTPFRACFKLVVANQPMNMF